MNIHPLNTFYVSIYVHPALLEIQPFQAKKQKNPLYCLRVLIKSIQLDGGPLKVAYFIEVNKKNGTIFLNSILGGRHFLDSNTTAAFTQIR